MTTKLLAIALAAGLMVGTGTSGFAQSPTSEKTPGAQMQDKGPAQGSPGASGYAPGHLKKKASVKRHCWWRHGHRECRR
jgi:hypothetical protein